MNLLMNLALVFGLVLVYVDAHKIFMTAGGSRSHKSVFDVVAKELGKRGHEVSLYSTYEDNINPKGVKNVYLREGDTAMRAGNVNFFQGTIDNPEFLAKMTEMFVDVCNKTYASPEIQHILKNPRNSAGEPLFDLAIIDPIFGEFLLPIAQLLKVPTVYLSPSLIFTPVAWNLNIPYPYSYLTNGMDEVIHPEGIFGRAMNIVKILGFSYYRQFQLHPRWNEVISNYLPDAKPLSVLESEVSFVMINWHLAIYPSAPRMPYFIDVGCLNCAERQPLPQDLEKFMNDSVEGVVYFSLGSYTKGELMPTEMRDKILQALSKLKQNVLFKYESPIEGISPNIKVISWAPQKNLLGHPKMRLFITHGGGLSMMEAAYNGCPLLAFPLSADQHGNMQFAKEKGFAEILDWKDFTLEGFSDKINLMLNDKSYAENAVKLSKLMKDNPQDRKELAAYWVEYVIRHKGAVHLKSGADKLNFFQYFLLDIIGVIVLVLIIFLVIFYNIVRAIYQCVYGRNQSKPNKLKTK